jgi:hypothetical protein
MEFQAIQGKWTSSMVEARDDIESETITIMTMSSSDLRIFITRISVD